MDLWNVPCISHTTANIHISDNLAHIVALGYHFAMKIDAIQTRNAYLNSNKKKKRYRIR